MNPSNHTFKITVCVYVVFFPLINQQYINFEKPEKQVLWLFSATENQEDCQFPPLDGKTLCLHKSWKDGL